MDSIKKEEFALRIQQANPTQLVVINFELAVAFLDGALHVLDTDPEAYRTQIDKAKDALAQLTQSLDFSVTLSHDFYDIYRYVGELLNRAFFTTDVAVARSTTQEARELMDTLLTGWHSVAEQHAHVPPVAKPGPTVYAGLTYGRDGADEYVDDDGSRGYTV